MSLFTTAIDNQTIFRNAHIGKTIGENGHAQFGAAPTSLSDSSILTPFRVENSNPSNEELSKNLQERIVQFQFQVVRCSPSDIGKLQSVLRSLLTDLVSNLSCDSVKPLLVVLYKIIGQTRDIDAGKGERDLAYMMILVWWEFFPSLAKLALYYFVHPVLSDELCSHSETVSVGLPYGSWKDIKRFCNYVFALHGRMHDLITYCVGLMCDQLRADASAGSDTGISLCSRWVPRETSKTGCWLFRVMAVEYFPEFVASAKSEDGIKKAYNKTYMTFARLVSGLSRRIDTVQIKMCGRAWSKIDHHKTPSVALLKNRAAFMNRGKNRGFIDDPDRIVCAANFESYISSRVKSGLEIKGKRIGLVDFVKNGIRLLNNVCGVDGVDLVEAAALNTQWVSFLSQVASEEGGLGNMVAMVDQSGSMDGDPYYAALGMGIAVATRSALGNRVMTFSTEPSWVSLDASSESEYYTDLAAAIDDPFAPGTFLGSIMALKAVDHLAGFGTNFFKALKLILDACVAGSVPDSVVCNMTLAIFSDMQIDAPYNKTREIYDCSNDYMLRVDPRANSFGDDMLSMHERISELYLAAGYSGVPHILFWNLRHTSGFPTMSSLTGATMFSGFSPMLLNTFCSKGSEALIVTTPWDALISSLDNHRYLILEKAISGALFHK